MTSLIGKVVTSRVNSDKPVEYTVVNVVRDRKSGWYSAVCQSVSDGIITIRATHLSALTARIQASR